MAAARIPRVLVAVGKGWTEHDPEGEALRAVYAALPIGATIRVLCSEQDRKICEQPHGFRFLSVTPWGKYIGFDQWDMMFLVHPYPAGSVRGRALAGEMNRRQIPVLLVKTIEEAKNWQYRATQ